MNIARYCSQSTNYKYALIWNIYVILCIYKFYVIQSENYIFPIFETSIFTFIISSFNNITFPMKHLHSPDLDLTTGLNLYINLCIYLGIKMNFAYVYMLRLHLYMYVWQLVDIVIACLCVWVREWEFRSEIIISCGRQSK